MSACCVICEPNYTYFKLLIYVSCVRPPSAFAAACESDDVIYGEVERREYARREICRPKKVRLDNI